MKTAVLLRQAVPRCTLFHGSPYRVVSTPHGDVGLLAGGELAAYLLETPRSRRLFIFRTLLRPDAAGARIPGVWPQVELLASFHRSGRIDRVKALFSYLAKHAWSPSTLSDLFWFRVSHALGGRLPRHKILLSLLGSERGQTAEKGTMAP